MAKTPKNHGTRWTKQDDALLRELARQNTPTRIIALKMKRTEGAIYAHAGEEGVSLKPTNQSPYNRRKG